MPKRGNGIEPVYRLVGQRLRWLREQRQWTLTEMAAKMDCHQSTLSQMELGRMRLAIAEFIRIIRILDVPPNKLLDKIATEQCFAPERRAKQHEQAARMRAAKRKPDGQQKKGR